MEQTITLETYLMKVGIRSSEYTYTDQELFQNIEYFRRCHNADLSAYKALLFLSDHIKGMFDPEDIYSQEHEDKTNS
jgi:hypothetical protein